MSWPQNLRRLALCELFLLEMSDKELLMPHSTACFPFEEKVFNFSTKYSKKRFGDVAYFRLVLTASGTIARSDSNREHRRSPDPEGHGTLEFDPFDWPEYAWIGWSAVAREHMERLIGVTIMDSDMSSAFDKLDAFPDTWSVMF